MERAPKIPLPGGWRWAHRWNAADRVISEIVAETDVQHASAWGRVVLTRGARPLAGWAINTYGTVSARASVVQAVLAAGETLGPYPEACPSGPTVLP